MYKTGDKEASIRSLQRYLSLIYDGKMTVNQNGRFDENTISALNRFQKENSFAITDKADYITFNAIYNAYVEKLSTRNLSKIYSQIRFPLTRGMRNNAVSDINSMMSVILDYYSIFYIAPSGDYFSEDTEDAVRLLRGIFNLPDIDVIDEFLYKRILDEYNSVISIKNNEGTFNFQS